MNFFPRLISKQIGRMIPAQKLFKQQTPVFLPFYHVVANEKLPHVLNYPYRNVNHFEKELDFYLKYFDPVALNEIGQTPGNKKVFHLSFDDGLKECAEVIAPILLKKGIPATFFVNTSFVDNLELFHKYKASLIFNALRTSPNAHAEKILAENNLAGDSILKAEIEQVGALNKVAEILDIDFQEYLDESRPYLTTGQIKQLYNQGFSIGAHSADHPEFYKITEEEQIEQVKKSMHWVNEIIHPKIKAFSFPFTDFGVPVKVLQTIKNENICDITFGTAGVKYDEFDFHFQRYPVEQAGDFAHNLKGEFVYFSLRKIINKATVRH